MSRDYKPSAEKPKSANQGSPFLSGLLIGVLLGIAASLGVVMFIKGGESPFTHQDKIEKSVADKMSETAKAEADAAAASEAEKAKNAGTDAANADDKTRFDFYTILPGSESKVTDEEKAKLSDPQPSAVQTSYFLQVGAFQTAEEADNLKAKLALQGFEALVQTVTIPNKGVLHRVRVGPLKDLDQINKTKSDLIGNGFKADLIKMNNENQ